MLQDEKDNKLDKKDKSATVGGLWLKRFVPHILFCLINKKKLKLPVLTGPLSGIQPFVNTLVLTSPGNWDYLPGYITNLAFEIPKGNYCTLGFVCSQHAICLRISNLHRYCSLRVPIHMLFECSLGDSIYVPMEVHVRLV